ncbi:MAG: hypothetical protein JST58_06185 [Bacteroidetes bacterium]|nr:hypothetical protein [Bacteroidota bacterium]
MKKIFTILLLMAAFCSHAQLYNNEWIDFSKTYYKFKIAADGLYRIPQSVIASAGLGSTPAQYFQLFRNGQEVPIYTSVASGPLGSSDYIEFWGRMNDGSADNVLYTNPAYQHTKKWSLETDTSVYFLTVNPTATTFHYNTINTDTTGNLLPVEPYFMYTASTAYRAQINAGYAQVVGEYLYSSTYDKGEFWGSYAVYPGASNALADTKTNLFLYTAGPSTATLRFGIVGQADNLRPSIQAIINNTVVKDTVLNSFNDLVTTTTIPTSLINSGTASIVYQNNCATPTDRVVVSFSDLTYPRQFDFGNQSNFYFELPAKASGYYLQVSDFNAGTAAPLLYDLSNGIRCNMIVVNNKYYAILPGSSSTRKLVMVSQDPSNINSVSSLTPKQFVNYANTSNQGNYLIISNPLLYSGGQSGGNPVAAYQQYRNSAAGGSFNAIVVDINELIDQFAFGIKNHPISIKNFLRFSRNKFASNPQYVFLIGHGLTYDQYRYNESNPNTPLLASVPTWGYPASDNLLSSADASSPVPLTPIGRLSVVSGAELQTYLQKMIEYEQAQQTAPNTVAGRGWMKNVVHVTGAADAFLGNVLCNYMNNYQQIIEDTLFGGNVTLFCDVSADVGTSIVNQQLSNLFTTGFSFLNYFGHSSAATLDYNLNDPSSYNNQGKYPVFFVNGCNAGNFFVFSQGRIQGGSKTLSETWSLANESGSIAFVASTSFSIVNYVNILINGLYNMITNQDYGKSLGIIQADAMQSLVNVAPGDYYAQTQAEQMVLHGDPALKLNNGLLPDYDVEASQVVISPSFVSIADTNFTVNAHLWNLGKAVSDSILIIVTRQYPNGTSTVLVQKKIPGIRTMDSISISVPILPTRDQGQNYISITVNADNKVPELTTANNSAKIGVYVYVNEAKPIYPYDYSIVSTQNQKIFASTADPLAPSKQYIMEMDTTALFNSPSLVSKTINSVGGALQFDPGISFRDSTVYYWRVSIAPTTTGGLYHWNQFSFLYLNNGTPGYNQSHFYQHTESGTNEIYNDSASRVWKYSTVLNSLYIPSLIYPTASGQQSSYYISINSKPKIITGCYYNDIMFNVIDPETFKLWQNNYSGTTGLYNSINEPARCPNNTIYNFDYLYTDSANRKKAMDFMDSIPNGYFVIVRLMVSPNDWQNTYINQWKADTAVYGSNNSLYHKLYSAGFFALDSFTTARAPAFIYKKNDLSFAPKSVISKGIYDQAFLSDYCQSLSLSGTVTSPLFGPAKQWTQLHWLGKSIESPSTDSTLLQVIGVDTLNNQTTLFTITPGTTDMDISSINAKQYPYLQLKMNTTDSAYGTPYQLKYWRLNYVPVPEGAIAPNIYLVASDTLEAGQPLQFAVAFKNISPYAFDSVALYLTVLDHNNVLHVIDLPKKKPLVSGDTLILSYSFDAKNFPGANTLYVDFNPNYAQPEQFTFNNFLYHNFYVKKDTYNPLLDVTFDGVHILNQDIVSAKPHILIKLTDESKYLLLNDTSMLKVQVRYPDGSLHNYNFNTDTLRFTPATSGGNNVATIDFYPMFTNQINAQGDQYTLYVTGKDASGNTTGAVQYQISFTVINKAMISNMLNYPNPFSTSTAFVFTITGSEVPQNIKIQILTITGKVVKEITSDELGPLHVGTNITQYKWDGTGMYGERLANGVYIYHVITNLNGKSLDKYRSANDNTDQYFTKGYGKMYLMR